MNNIELLGLTSQVTASYVGNNAVKSAALPDFIKSVYGAFADLAAGKPKLEPAVAIAESIKPTYIVCLEDGKKLKMLKRHLWQAFNLTPAQYRERWGLPADYPMTAPAYAKRRSQIAKEFGLGQR